jgi:hypothetical protein
LDQLHVFKEFKFSDEISPLEYAKLEKIPARKSQVKERSKQPKSRRFRMVDVAEIFIWGELAGAVRWDEQQQLASFQYATRFLQKGWDLSPLKMPIREGSRIYSFPELRKEKDNASDTFKGLPGLLADALPDRYGNQLINILAGAAGTPC